jgi:hypothetical protein
MIRVDLPGAQASGVRPVLAGPAAFLPDGPVRQFLRFRAVAPPWDVRESAGRGVIDLRASRPAHHRSEPCRKASRNGGG